MTGSSRPSILVDDATQDTMSADRGVKWDGEGGIVVGWAALAAQVWAVIVEVSGELVHDRDCVTFVVDQHAVGALRSDTAHEPLGVTVGCGDCGGIFTTSTPSEANTAPNDPVYFVSRSRTRNRNSFKFARDFPNMFNERRSSYDLADQTAWSRAVIDYWRGTRSGC